MVKDYEIGRLTVGMTVERDGGAATAGAPVAVELQDNSGIIRIYSTRNFSVQYSSRCEDSQGRASRGRFSFR